MRKQTQIRPIPPARNIRLFLLCIELILEGGGREKKVLRYQKPEKISVKEKLSLGNLLDKESSSWGWSCNAI